MKAQKGSFTFKGYVEYMDVDYMALACATGFKHTF